MKTMYLAEDGKQFETEKECKAYEEKKLAEASEKLKKEKEREARQQEVEDAYKNYKDLMEKFLDDYGTYTKKYTDSVSDYPFLHSLFKAFDLV